MYSRLIQGGPDCIPSPTECNADVCNPCDLCTVFVAFVVFFWLGGLSFISNKRYLNLQKDARDTVFSTPLPKLSNEIWIPSFISTRAVHDANMWLGRSKWANGTRSTLHDAVRYYHAAAVRYYHAAAVRYYHAAAVRYYHVTVEMWNGNPPYAFVVEFYRCYVWLTLRSLTFFLFFFKGRMHCDGSDNLYVLLKGKKKLRIFSPSQVIHLDT